MNLSKLRTLARLAVSVAYSPTANAQTEALKKLRRFVNRNVEEGADSLSHEDVAIFDITEVRVKYPDFSCLVNDKEYSGDFSISSRSEEEAFPEDIRVFRGDEKSPLEDELLTEAIETQLQEYCDEHSYEFYTEKLSADAEHQRESQEDR